MHTIASFGCSWRRRALAPLLLGWCLAATAQTPFKAVGVFSLLGDSVQVTAATEMPSDTRLQRSARESMEFKDIGFDLIASRVAREAVTRAHPMALASVFRSSAPLDPQAQRAIAEGAARGELPSWMVQTIVARKLSHVLIISRSRGPADMRTGDGNAIGRGNVEGIGFYLDALYRMKNIDTGARSPGLIGTYVQLRLTLLDTQTAEVTASYDVRDGVANASPEDKVVADPWSFLTPQQKVLQLRRLVEQGMVRGMQQLLQPR